MESMMRSKVVGLVAAAALSASVGIANAQRPVKLTDGQLDKVTAGANYTSANMGGNMGAYYMGANVLSANVAANAAAMAALNNMAAVNTAAAAFANAAITP
jgi:hypothetical protein